MITTVMFDMGGTLEDIWVDEASETAAIAGLDRMLKGWGFDTGLSPVALRAAVDAGWKRYDVVRSAGDVELKPIEIWCDYILTDFAFPREALARVAKGRRILAVELDAGQFADDVRLNLAKSGLGEEAASVRMLHRMGGEVVAVDAVLAEVEKMMKG